MASKHYDAVIMPQAALSGWLAEIGKTNQVIAPVKRGVETAFAPLEDGGELNLDFVISLMPPKEFLTPPREEMFTWRPPQGFGGPDLRETPRRVIFGVHPCDMHGIFVLDRVFSGDYPDTQYWARRERTLLLPMNCVKAEPNCLCTTFDTGPGLDLGFDLLFTPLDGHYLVEIGTYQGSQLVQSMQWEPAGPEYLEQKAAAIDRARSQINRTIDLTELTDFMAAHRDHPRWQQEADRCLACGTCTMVCPSCFCFNIKDATAVDFKSMTRERTWDSCQLLEFAQVAFGENFRRERVKRLMQRIYHKLSYWRDQWDVYGCTGCGRCSKYCIAKIDMVAMLEDMRRVGA